ncbi:MAG: hypothetical protein ACFE9I_14080 [Candidatus Hermodarchaeota archaeon]
MKLHSNRKFINDRENREKLNRKIKQTLNLKNIKIYLIVFILLWCFSSILQVTLFHFDNRDDRVNKDFVVKPSSGDSVTVQWIRLWGDKQGTGGKGIAVDSSDNVYTISEIGLYGYYPENIKSFLVKYDSSGMEQWNRTWVRTWSGKSLSEINEVSLDSVTVDSLDNVYVVGTTSTNFNNNFKLIIILMKYDSSGVQQWNRTWDANSLGAVDVDVAVDSFGNVYVSGCTWTGAEGTNLLLVKYDNSGVLQWNRTWGGNYSDNAIGVKIDSNDNVYVVGNIYGLEIQLDMVLLKYDSSGVLIWNRTWGSSGWEEVKGIALDSLDNIYVSGYTGVEAEEDNMVLVKYDSSGVQQWNRTWIGIGPDWLVKHGIAVDSFDNVYLTGSIEEGIALVKYNSSGGQQWYHILNFITVYEGSALAVDSSNNIYISGHTLWRRPALVKCVLSNITINFPNQLGFFGRISPIFDISINNSNLDSTWYTLDGGLTNITFSGITRTINQAEWDKHGEGIVEIRFYMNNTNGNEEYVEVSVIKDISSPKITIISPVQNEKYGSQPPSYILSIVEPNFEILRIFARNIMFDALPDDLSEVSGTFSQDDWDKVPQGEVTITFWVRDITGKEVSISIVIIKEIRLRQPFLYFPLVIFVSILFIGVSVYYINKNRKLPKLTQEELDSL